MVIGHVTGWEGEGTRKFLLSDEPKKTWLWVLAKHIERLLRPNASEILNIVTFNYDRILERYLLNVFGSHPEYTHKIKLFIDDRIHHVYGRIGKLEGLAEAFPGEDAIEFAIADNSNFAHLAKFKNNIKFIRSSIDTEKIKGVVKGANKIIILGYGLDPINNRRVGLLEWTIPRDQNLKFNIYPGSSTTPDFAGRRQFEEKIRTVRIDADIQYRSCYAFMEYALKAHLIKSPEELKRFEEQRTTY